MNVIVASWQFDRSPEYVGTFLCFYQLMSKAKFQSNGLLSLNGMMESLWLAVTICILDFGNGQKELSWEGIYNPWCGSNIPFCLFSIDPVSDLPDARSRCYDLKTRSYPVELGSDSTRELLTEYIRNYSISNVMLNAVRRNKSWYWVRGKNRIRNFSDIIVRGNILLYDRDDSVGISNVCMLSCRYLWDEFADTSLNAKTTDEISNASITRDCRDICRRDESCSSITVAQISGGVFCQFFEYPYQESLQIKAPDITLHVINRSSKTLKRCFKDDLFDPEITSFSMDYTPIVIVGVIVLFLLALCLCASAEDISSVSSGAERAEL